MNIPKQLYNLAQRDLREIEREHLSRDSGGAGASFVSWKNHLWNQLTPSQKLWAKNYPSESVKEAHEESSDQALSKKHSDEYAAWEKRHLMDVLDLTEQGYADLLERTAKRDRQYHVGVKFNNNTNFRFLKENIDIAFKIIKPKNRR